MADHRITGADESASNPAGASRSEPASPAPGRAHAPDVEVVEPVERRRVLRDAAGVGIATGAIGLSFGAVSTASGLSVLQTCALSLLMFTGGSQFALVGVLGAGGSGVAGAATAIMLGSRNALYSLRLATLLRLRGVRRFSSSQLVIDESTAMAVGRSTDAAGRLGFYSTGIAVFVLWNLGTLLGGLGAEAISDPGTFGLDAAGPAAFLALLASRLRLREPQSVAVLAGMVAVLSAPFLPIGIPVLVATVPAVGVGLLSRRGR